MKKTIFNPKRSLSALLALILALPLSVAAEEIVPDTAETSPSAHQTVVVPNFEYSFVKGRATVIDTCDIVGPWLWGENVSGVLPTTSLDSYPFVSADQSGCIRVRGDGVKGGEWVTIKRTLDNGVDYSRYKNLIFTVCSDHIGEGDIYAMVELRGQKAVVEESEVELVGEEENTEELPFEEVRRFESEPLFSETWNGLICDISDWEGASSVVEITIGLCFVPYEQSDILYNVNYNIDFFAGAESENFEREVYFMSDSYSASGTDNSVSFSSDPVMMTLGISYSRAEQCALYSGALPEGIMDSADALKIRLANYSSCSKMTLEYATATQPSYKQNPAISVSLDSSAGMQSIYFRLPDKKITELKISFDSESDGIIEFYSISPASYYAPIDKRLGEAVSGEGYITSCKLDDSQNIMIRGALSDVGVSAYKGLKVQLYELTGNMPTEKLFDGSLRPLKSVAASSALTFEIPLYDGQRSRISSRFALAVYNEAKNQITLLTAPAYITNPEFAGDRSDAVYTMPNGKKGLVSSPDVAAEAGVSSTVVDVDIGKLFTVSKEGIAHRYDGKTYYFDASYIEQLDRHVKDMYISNTTVNLRLLLTKPTYSDFVETLIDPSSISRVCCYYGFSLSSEESISYLSVGCDFLANRYCRADAKYGLVSGVIVGARLDLAYRYYNTGAKNLREFADSYCRAFRTVANTMRAVGGNVRMYIPIGGEWDGLLSDGQYFNYYSRDLADIFAEQMRAEGNIAYGYVVDFYDLGKRALSDVNKNASLINGEAGVRTLDQLCAYLKKSRFTYENLPRPIIVAKAPDPLFDMAFTLTERQARLEYILLYTAVCSDFASNVESVIFDSSLIDGEMASFVSLLRDIDTHNYSSVTDYALGQYGIGDWSDIISGYKTALSPSRVCYIKAGEQSLSPDVFGTSPLWIDQSHDVTYTVGSSVIGFDTNVDFNGLSSAVSVYFSDNGGLKAIGKRFTHQRDLTFAPIISFNLYSDRDDTVTVVFDSASGRYEFECSVVGGRWNKVVCDLENMEGIQAIDKMTFYANNSLEMALAGFNASSRVNDSESIAKKFAEEHESLTPSTPERVDQVTVLVLALVIVFALAAEIVYIAVRRRRADAEHKKEKRLVFGKKH
ncbi:MAG: hypothetical protein IKT54_06540 [Clostridia bacterium]|nr:hypothetical protein [Clostridia bacterium]